MRGLFVVIFVACGLAVLHASVLAFKRSKTGSAPQQGDANANQSHLITVATPPGDSELSDQITKLQTALVQRTALHEGSRLVEKPQWSVKDLDVANVAT
eukprot:2432113-Pyramimonas_sp.AAC.1